MQMLKDDERAQLRESCEFRLIDRPPRRNPQEQERRAALWPSVATDAYGEGGGITELETQVSEILNRPTLFFPSGSQANLAALLTSVALRRGDGGDPISAARQVPIVVAAHPRSHIACDEPGADSALVAVYGHQLRKIGNQGKPITDADLNVALALGKPDVISVELPLRRDSFGLVEWSGLVSVRDWCNTHKVPLHIDGARLWEAAAAYGIDRAIPFTESIREVAGLADSGIVALDKGLGGTNGSLVFGDEKVIADARQWRKMMFLPQTNVSAARSGQFGIDTVLPTIPARVAAVRALAAQFDAHPDLATSGGPCVAAGFRLHFPGQPDQAQQRHDEFAKNYGVWGAEFLAPSTNDGVTVAADRTMMEIEYGNMAAELGPDVVLAALTYYAGTDMRGITSSDAVRMTTARQRNRARSGADRTQRTSR